MRKADLLCRVFTMLVFYAHSSVTSTTIHTCPRIREISLSLYLLRNQNCDNTCIFMLSSQSCKVHTVMNNTGLLADEAYTHHTPLVLLLLASCCLGRGVDFLHVQNRGFIPASITLYFSPRTSSYLNNMTFRRPTCFFTTAKRLGDVIQSCHLVLYLG